MFYICQCVDISTKILFEQKIQLNRLFCLSKSKVLDPVQYPCKNSHMITNLYVIILHHYEIINLGSIEIVGFFQEQDYLRYYKSNKCKEVKTEKKKNTSKRF